MDRKTSERFRRSLEQRHRELTRRLSRTQQEALHTPHEAAKDEGDRASISLTKEVNLNLTSRDRVLLNAIGSALKRIGEGSFGECLNCGEDISVKRLEAIPWARYCITCQELFDESK